MSQSAFTSCQHPEVPPLGENLQIFSYRLEPLIAQTKAFFETKDLLPSQEEAMDSFLFLFILYQDQTYTDLVILEVMTECLDAFFFGGQLMSDKCGTRKILRCLELEEDIFPATCLTDSPELYGAVENSMPLGQSRLEQCAPSEWAVTISVNLSTEDELPHSLHSILETLVNEMVHGFLQSFLCYPESCEAERASKTALGPLHHGPMFMELLSSISRVIREWNMDLAAFYLLEDSADIQRVYCIGRTSRQDSEMDSPDCLGE